VDHGPDGNDEIHGGSGYDQLRDQLHGGDWVDTLEGGDDGDFLYGEGDGDWLLGQGGPDSLSGGASNDQLSGGSANDTLYAFGDGGARDLLNCGTGIDTAHVDLNDAFYVGARNNVTPAEAGCEHVVLHVDSYRPPPLTGPQPERAPQP
jgi:Ca2+-binding RTX toxin-like protein